VVFGGLGSTWNTQALKPRASRSCWRRDFRTESSVSWGWVKVLPEAVTVARLRISWRRASTRLSSVWFWMERTLGDIRLPPATPLISGDCDCDCDCTSVTFFVTESVTEDVTESVTLEFGRFAMFFGVSECGWSVGRYSCRLGTLSVTLSVTEELYVSLAFRAACVCRHRAS